MLKSSSNVSHDDMLAACESDKVAASRAMVQNKQLKEQLTELENQFIQLVIMQPSCIYCIGLSFIWRNLIWVFEFHHSSAMFLNMQ